MKKKPEDYSASELPTVLAVGGEALNAEALKKILQDYFDVKIALNSPDAERILEREWVQIIICDQEIPETTGLDFLGHVRKKWPDVIRVIISDDARTDHSSHNIRDSDIFQYIVRPRQAGALIMTLRNAVRLFELQRENEQLTVELELSSSHAKKSATSQKAEPRNEILDGDGIIRSETSPMNVVCDKIMQVSPYDVSVLLLGESGTGKELAARALHSRSLRWNKPFVVENCAALPDELLESELFGHKRGAFTGAVDDHVGLFERSDGGTVFLDEIGEISRAFQVKLLRVLQEGEIRPVGSGRTRSVNIRVIAATNKMLDEEVRAGRFREDLYYRLAAISIKLPPLRARPDDIAVIAGALLEKQAVALGKKVAGLSQEALDCLKRYRWPGNVRELQNELQHMLVMGQEDALLGADLISPHILRGVDSKEATEIEAFAGLSGTLKERIAALEVTILREVLIRHRWNKSRAARELGLSRVGLRNKLERYGLAKPMAYRKNGAHDGPSAG